MNNKKINNKNINNKNINIILNICFVSLFIYILTNFKKFNENTNLYIIKYLGTSQIAFYIFLTFIVIINFILCKYNRLSGGILFLIFCIIIRNNINRTIYLEPFFQNNDISQNTEYIKNKVMEDLKLQVSNDPNITDIEKNEINKIYDKYFLQSDNLNILTRFNEKASEVNPVNNNQKIEDILNFYK